MRVQRVEHEVAIRNLVVRYGLAVDTGNAEATADTFTDDAEYDIGPLMTGDGTTIVIRNRFGITNELVLGKTHQRLLPDCAHTIGPVIVLLEGSTASVAGYSRIYHHEDGRFTLFRIGLNQWRLIRGRDGSWKIKGRTSRVLGNKDGQAQLIEGLERIRGQVSQSD